MINVKFVQRKECIFDAVICSLGDILAFYDLTKELRQKIFLSIILDRVQT
jgi:hypothetical protein